MAEGDLEEDVIFHYVDLMEEVEAMLARPSLQGQLYTRYEKQVSKLRSERAYGQANSAGWFEWASSKYPDCRPVGVMLYSDGSFFGVHKDAHPIYGTP